MFLNDDDDDNYSDRHGTDFYYQCRFLYVYVDGTRSSRSKVDHRPFIKSI